MKNVAAAGRIPQGQVLAGWPSRGGIGDGRRRTKTTVLQFQPARAPGSGVAVRFQTQQLAVRAISLGAHQDGPAVLEDLIGGAEPDGRAILLLVAAPRPGHCLGDGVVDATHGQGLVEGVPEQFQDRPGRAQGDVAQAAEERFTSASHSPSGIETAPYAPRRFVVEHSVNVLLAATAGLDA